MPRAGNIGINSPGWAGPPAFVGNFGGAGRTRQGAARPEAALYQHAPYFYGIWYDTETR